jgi:hypothetical protein
METYAPPKCPMCGDRMHNRYTIRATPRGEIEYVDRICRGCGWVDFDDEGGV